MNLYLRKGGGVGGGEQTGIPWETPQQSCSPKIGIASQMCGNASRYIWIARDRFNQYIRVYTGQSWKMTSTWLAFHFVRSPLFLYDLSRKNSYCNVLMQTLHDAVAVVILLFFFLFYFIFNIESICIMHFSFLTSGTKTPNLTSVLR